MTALRESAIVLLCGGLIWCVAMIAVQAGQAASDAVNRRRQ